MKKLFVSLMFVFLLPLSLLANAGTWGAGVEDRSRVRVVGSMDLPTVAMSYGYPLNGAAVGICSPIGATRKYYTTIFIFPQPGPILRGVMIFYKQTCV